MKKLLEGPTALMVGFGDATTNTKTLFQFIKEVEKGEVKGGFFEGEFMTKDELKQIASLPSKEELLGQIAGLLVANVRDIAGIFESVIRDNAILIEEVAKKQEAASSAQRSADSEQKTEEKKEEPKAEEKKEEKKDKKKDDDGGPKLP